MLTSDSIKTLADLRRFAEPMVGPDLYTHATRYDDNIDSILRSGIKPGRTGKVSSTPTSAANHGGGLGSDAVRHIGSGYVVFRAEGGRDVEDVVSASERYPETEFSFVKPEQIVKVVRMVTDKTGHRIREDELARYALDNPNSDDPNLVDLPERYQRWFTLSEGSLKLTVGSLRVLLREAFEGPVQVYRGMTELSRKDLERLVRRPVDGNVGAIELDEDVPESEATWWSPKLYIAMAYATTDSIRGKKSGERFDVLMLGRLADGDEAALRARAGRLGAGHIRVTHVLYAKRNGSSTRRATMEQLLASVR